MNIVEHLPAHIHTLLAASPNSAQRYTIENPLHCSKSQYRIAISSTLSKGRSCVIVVYDTNHSCHCQSAYCILTSDPPPVTGLSRM
ncbi:hypothetical protein Y032_0150g2735 [Ancylostoma ceylanicum]|uniref:Uncharacterized protein n=1 Tax=Ancylostoma ceylanicum TaxID=53326 RepID=A0A016T1E8_9BILA|nr:hypothetical protein Y032_0150g2735 [Ancylostoma ceylanicum]